MMERAGLKQVALGLAGLVLAGCGHQEERPGGRELERLEVKTGQATIKEEARRQWLPGTVFPADQAIIASKLMATVDLADIIIGQKVSEGEVLIELRADEIDAQVEQARAGLAQVERNLAREQALLAKSATTAEAVRTLEDQARLARARLAEAETMESYKTIRAPFAGTITVKSIRRGDLATPGMPLLTLEGEDGMQVHVQVPESLSALPLGSKVVVEADEELITATLSEWSPAADPASRTRLAKLDVPAEAAARSGQYVRVSWPGETAQSYWIPQSALSPLGQMERVFVAADGVARLRLVRTGRKDNDLVQILSGLDDPEAEVILAPGADLRDGQPIQVQP